MAVVDIADITRAIIKVIDESLKISGHWPPPETLPAITPVPPNKMKENGLSFFLYHVQENAANKNMLPLGKDQPPIRFTPMGLDLYYQLSANHKSDELEDTDMYKEQLMMSVAMKALHEYPEINDDTVVDPASKPIFEQFSIQGKDNRFKISVQPIPYNEAVHYWTAGQSAVKLSAYYEVSVIFLEPEKSTSRAGRVLTYGTYIFTEGSPQITASYNIISFAIPGQPTVQEIKLEPAQAPAKSLITFLGTGFTGDRIEILLFNSRWSVPAMVDKAWAVAITGGNQIQFTIQETAMLQDRKTTVNVLPGIYSAQVVAVRERTLPSGEVREFRNGSNQSPFTISPRVDEIKDTTAVSPVVVGNVWTVTTNTIQVTGHLFQDALKDLDTQVYLGENTMTNNPSGTLAAGEFKISTKDALELNITGRVTKGQILLLRILVEGAESPPNWITVL